MRMRLAWVLPWVMVVAVPCFARAEANQDALATYEDRAVGVRTIVPLGRDGVTLDRTGSITWDAFQGRDHHPIDDETFFRIVGRDDLASRVRHRMILRKSLAAGGGVMIVGGALYSTLSFLSGGGQPAPACVGTTATCISSPQSSWPSPGWGLIAIGTGVASIIVSHFVDPTPIGAAEADTMARDHDEQLKATLGLSDVAASD